MLIAGLSFALNVTSVRMERQTIVDRPDADLASYSRETTRDAIKIHKRNCWTATRVAEQENELLPFVLLLALILRDQQE